MKAGESSYFSSASLGSGFGAALWPEDRAIALSKNRHVKKLALNILKPFKLNKGIADHKRRVRQIFNWKHESSLN
jgi:hypothetical protein